MIVIQCQLEWSVNQNNVSFEYLFQSIALLLMNMWYVFKIIFYPHHTLKPFLSALLSVLSILFKYLCAFKLHVYVCMYEHMYMQSPFVEGMWYIDFSSG